jgi:hypothetical protein
VWGFQNWFQSSNSSSRTRVIQLWSWLIQSGVLPGHSPQMYAMLAQIVIDWSQLQHTYVAGWHTSITVPVQAGTASAQACGVLAELVTDRSSTAVWACCHSKWLTAPAHMCGMPAQLGTDSTQQHFLNTAMGQTNAVITLDLEILERSWIQFWNAQTMLVNITLGSNKCHSFFLTQFWSNFNVCRVKQMSPLWTG